MRRYFLASILLLISGTAHAAGPAAPQPTGHSPAPAQAGEATRIETDQKTGAIRFIVNGKEEARIDATGLHVRQAMAYGGDLIDTGPAYYDTPAKAEPKH